MTAEQSQVQKWMVAYGQDCPSKPTIPDEKTRYLRAKIILEEARETINALGFDVELDFHNNVSPDWIVPSGPPANLVDIADGCEDLKVVTEGTLVACGLVQEGKTWIDENGNDFFEEIDPLFDEVMKSNWTKLWTFDEVHKKGVVTNGDSPAFDPTAIVATNTLCDEDSNTYKVVRLGSSDKEPFRDFLVKDSSGKVIKSPSYSPPELADIIKEMH